MTSCAECPEYLVLRERADQQVIAKAARASPTDHVWLCVYMREWQQQIEKRRNGQAQPTCRCQAVRERLWQAKRMTDAIAGPAGKNHTAARGGAEKMRKADESADGARAAAFSSQ